MEQPLCPKCLVGFVRRSRRKGPVERLISLFSIYPFRCQLCQCRFRLRQKGNKYQRVDEDRREYERLPVKLAATFLTRGMRGQGTIMDISMAGCSLCTEEALEPGNILYIELQAPGQVDPVLIDVSIVRGTGSSHASVEFLRFEGDARERLQRFIRGLISDVSSANA